MNLLVRILLRGISGILIIVIVTITDAPVFAENDGEMEAGKKIYDRRCRFCHGSDGRGNGPVAEYLIPRPRNFVTALFKYRTTESGYPPTDADLNRVIERGVPGTAMPSFEGVLEERRKEQVIKYIKTFSDIFTDPELDPGKHMVVADAVNLTSGLQDQGKDVYRRAECFKCHGETGRGNGESAAGLTDQRGFPIVPRNLTKAWKYGGGTEVEDIYTRFTTGMDGTPMPSFADNLTDDERWYLSHYVNSLIRDIEMDGVVIKSRYARGDLPSEPDDPEWDKADSIDVVLTGQVLARPRWQIPSVDLITVRSIYNDSEIAFLLEWDDRFKDVVHKEEMVDSESDIEYTYVKLYTSISAEVEEWISEEDFEWGGESEEDEKVTPQWILRDSVDIQFPVKIPDGPVKPFFFLGNSGEPVNLWRWKADLQEDSGRDSAVEEYNATGFKNPVKIQPPDSQETFSRGYWKDGRWKVVLKRALVTENERGDIQFEKGKLIPVAFHAWDGSNGEAGLKMSLSSWYYLSLETDTPIMAYIYGFIGTVVIALAEILLVKKSRSNSQ